MSHDVGPAERPIKLDSDPVIVDALHEHGPDTSAAYQACIDRYKQIPEFSAPHEATRLYREELRKEEAERNRARLGIR